METILYRRIVDECKKRGITIAQLERECHMSSTSIKKWKSASTPGVDKVRAVANYFGVSMDYLVGDTDIPTPIEKAYSDPGIISIQRARTKMTPEDIDIQDQMNRLLFKYAFQEPEDK